MTTLSLESKIVEVISQLQHLAPKGASLALQAAQIEGVNNLRDGAVSLCIGVGLSILWQYKYRPWMKQSIKDGSFDDMPAYFGGGVLWLLIFIFSFMGLDELTSIWNWTALTHPELWIAHKIIGGA